MKVVCDGLDLSDAVLKVSKALPVKSANPVLEGIKIKAEGNTLTLLATDMDITIEKKIKADVLMEGETVVVGKYFVDFVKKLEKEQVELLRLHDAQLQIKYSDSESELQVFPSENYPKFEKKVEGEYFDIKQEDFKSLVEKTTLSCSTDDGRPILKGCLFEIENNVLTTVALDGFRMSVVKSDVQASGNIKAVIPARALLEITRLLDKDNENIRIFIQKNAIFVELNSTSIMARLIEGEFVKYKHILPSSLENVVTVNREAFLTSIERAAVVAKNDRYNVVKLDIKENVMNVSSKSEIGNVSENVNITLVGKDLTIAFNGKYLLEYLKTETEDFVNINLNSQIDPCVITPTVSDKFIYLVLPVRINA